MNSQGLPPAMYFLQKVNTAFPNLGSSVQIPELLETFLLVTTTVPFLPRHPHCLAKPPACIIHPRKSRHLSTFTSVPKLQAVEANLTAADRLHGFLLPSKLPSISGRQKPTQLSLHYGCSAGLSEAATPFEADTFPMDKTEVSRALPQRAPVFTESLSSGVLMGVRAMDLFGSLSISSCQFVCPKGLCRTWHYLASIILCSGTLVTITYRKIYNLLNNLLKICRNP